MFSFSTFLIATRDIVLIGAGAVAALTLEHGWGWVLAKYHAYRAAAQAKASDIFSEVTSQVSAATATIKTDVASIESRVTALEAVVKPAAK